MRWTDSLAVEAGLAAVVVDLPSPPEMTDDDRRMADRFAILYAINAHAHGPVPLMLTRRFATDWTGLSDYSTRAALRRLRDLDVIREVGESDSHRTAGRGAKLYVPGDGGVRQWQS